MLGKWGEKPFSVRQFENLTWCLRCIWGRKSFPKIFKCSPDQQWENSVPLLSAQGLTLADVELKLLQLLRNPSRMEKQQKWQLYCFPCHQLHQLEVHVQAELICSGCFDLTLGSTEWVCQHLFVEKTNSSGLHRGISSSTSYSARDETAACSLAFLQSFFSWIIWGGFLLCSQVSAPWGGATCVQLPLAWLPDCPTRCLAPHCRLPWLWH